MRLFPRNNEVGNLPRFVARTLRLEDNKKFLAQSSIVKLGKNPSRNHPLI